MDPHSQLRQVLSPDGEFRGVQEPAIRAILQGNSPVVAVMGTGGGKSLLFILPALCEPAGTKIVVVPLISLREDLKARCEKVGLRCSEWDSQRPPDAASIVLVTPESAVSVSFRTFLNRLRNAQRLDRIYIDECHVVLNDSETYRKELQQLGELIGAETRLVLLTATLPPSKESKLWSRMHFKPDEVHMLRASTSRANVRYQVISDPNNKKEGQTEFLLQLVQRKRRQWTGGKILVYCNSIGQCDMVAARSGCAAYHSRAKDKVETLQHFKQGLSSIIVATSSLGLGFDVLNVRVVLDSSR